MYSSGCSLLYDGCLEIKRGDGGADLQLVLSFPNIRLSEIGIHIDRCLSDKKGRENHNQEYISISTLNPSIICCTLAERPDGIFSHTVLGFNH